MADAQGAFLGLPAYRERYGEYVNEAAGYQLTPAWQAGLGQCSGVAAIISIFVTAWFQQRYGYRVVIQTGLVLMIAAIFVVFFAKNIVSAARVAVPVGPFLYAGHARCRLPPLRMGLVSALATV